MTIPKGTSKKDRDARRKIIEDSLSKIKGKHFNCPCLGGVPVYITGNSISEIADKACLRYKSTLGAIYLPEMIKNARFFKMHLPKDNRQQTKMNFIFVYELHTKTEDFGVFKLIVGVRINAMFLHYSITAI